MDKLTFRLTGIAPLLMHNSRGADPLDPLTQQLKALTGKKNKTEADLERVSEAEFYVSIYTNADGHPIIPANMAHSNLIKGAQKTKEGKLAKAGAFVLDDALLDYEGPKTPEELFKAGYFLRANVKNKQSTIQRTRPRFLQWGATISILYDPNVANKQQVAAWLSAGGAYEGYGDWRPQHGRFTAQLV